jgi:hypothetical protein
MHWLTDAVSYAMRESLLRINVTSLFDARQAIVKAQRQKAEPQHGCTSRDDRRC